MVAAARLRKAEEKAAGARPYADKVGELLRRASANVTGFDSPLLRAGEVKKVGYLVISADKGLAGAYNSNVMKKIVAEISDKDRDSYKLYLCGKQSHNYLKFRGIQENSYHFGFSDKPQAQDALELAKEMIDEFISGEVDEVYVIYTKFFTALRQQVTMTRLLPIVADAGDIASQDAADNGVQAEPEEFIFLPDANTVLTRLLPEYVQVQIYSSMLQSAASELGSRMAAMTAATDNATERIADLNLTYNKARQAQITNEISEIVGGANALE